MVDAGIVCCSCAYRDLVLRPSSPEAAHRAKAHRIWGPSTVLGYFPQLLCCSWHSGHLVDNLLHWHTWQGTNILHGRAVVQNWGMDAFSLPERRDPLSAFFMWSFPCFVLLIISLVLNACRIQLWVILVGIAWGSSYVLVLLISANCAAVLEARPYTRPSCHLVIITSSM